MATQAFTYILAILPKVIVGAILGATLVYVIRIYKLCLSSREIARPSKIGQSYDYIDEIMWIRKIRHEAEKGHPSARKLRTKLFQELKGADTCKQIITGDYTPVHLNESLKEDEREYQ